MSLARYEDFFYKACLVDDPDPVTAWVRQSEDVQRLAEWIQGKEEVHIQGPGTDIKLESPAARSSRASASTTCPTASSSPARTRTPPRARSRSRSRPPTAGREVGGVKLRFEGGKVVDASAEVGEELLLETLETDPGARILGELGIGTNFGIETGTKSILLDEKIGGTIHLAIGASYPQTGGTNDSAVHWDMICDLRQGGTITVDGESHAARRQVRRLTDGRRLDLSHGRSFQVELDQAPEGRQGREARRALHQARPRDPGRGEGGRRRP